tara:strand:+ start:1975 stop:2235 length:261 start_codon:yes stop_codon:yes gene_type:complete
MEPIPNGPREELAGGWDATCSIKVLPEQLSAFVSGTHHQLAIQLAVHADSAEYDIPEYGYSIQPPLVAALHGVAHSQDLQSAVHAE